MKLYSNICVGLLVIFLCQDNIPKATSDFCQQVRPEIQKFQRLTADELAALQRPRKEAILELRRKYSKLCT